MRALFLVLTTFIFSTTGLQLAQATEIDDTSTFYAPLDDSTAALDASVQRIIDQALSQHHGCNNRVFGRILGYYLTGNLFFGVIEREVNSSTGIPKIQLSVGDSIYGGSYSVMSRFFGLGAVVRIAGQVIGTDKIGHFFDMGFHLRALRAQGRTIEQVLAQSRWEEEGLWGMWSTGIKSYGDITANFDGHRFWRDIYGEGDDPYFACADGRIKQRRAFRWADYVTAAWTESINCSSISTPAIQTVVKENIAKLEKLHPERRYACPIVPQACGEIRKHYGRWIPAELLGEIISPDCR